MASTPYQTSEPLLHASTLTSLATTSSTNTTPYGFTTAAQADAIVTQLNAVIALLKAKGLGSIQ